MEAEGEESYFLQDDLGSPVVLTDQNGQSVEQYSYDEFGTQKIYTREDVFKTPMQSIQPFGFTGYQMDEAGGLYFAPARRYDAGIGRFISEDKVRGFIETPFTMNHYGYCWNRPMDLVDLNGMWPSWIENTVKAVTVAVAVVAVGAAIVCTGGAALVAGVAAGAAIGGVISGFANEANGGSYTNGWVGGAIAGGVQAVASTYFGPIGTVIGGTMNGVGSFITDNLDNKDASVSKKKTDEQIVQDAEAGALKGMAFSLPGAFMQGATTGFNPMDYLKSSTRGRITNQTAVDLMGLDNQTVNGLNQFYGAIDNGLIAADSTGNLFEQSMYEGAKE